MKRECSLKHSFQQKSRNLIKMASNRLVLKEGGGATDTNQHFYNLSSVHQEALLSSLESNPENRGGQAQQQTVGCVCIWRIY